MPPGLDLIRIGGQVSYVGLRSCRSSTASNESYQAIGGGQVKQIVDLGMPPSAPP